MRARSIWKPGPGNRAGAERIPIGVGKGGLQSHRVTLELFDDGEQIVRDGCGLGALCMRVHGEHGFAMAVHEVEQRPAQVQRRGNELQQQLPLPHPVHGHVDVVAAARRVQASGRVFTARVDDQPLDVAEEIFVAAVVGDAANLGLGHGIERDADRMRVVGRHDLLVGEHHQMRILNRHQRRQEQRFRVFEVVVEHGPHVLRGKPHDGAV